MDTSQLLGGAWLVAHYGLDLVMPLPVQSRIGGRRSTCNTDETRVETYVASMRLTCADT